MTRDEKVAIVGKLIKDGIASGKFMTVDFIKKTTGELRHMQVRRSKLLEANVKGTMPEATAARKATLRANDMLLVEELVKPATNEFQWRTITLKGVKRIVANGQVHEFE